MPSVLLAFVRNVIGSFPVLSIAVALLGGMLSSGGAVWAGKDWWFDHVSAPQIRQTQQKTDADTYEAAADAAQKTAQLAKFKAIEAVTQQFVAQQQADQAAEQAQLDQLNKENADYEQQLRARGRSYTLDQSDVDYLNGVRPQP